MTEQEPPARAPSDAEAPEAGSPEAGSPEAGSPEAGSPEAGSPEAGSPEADPPEAADVSGMSLQRRLWTWPGRAREDIELRWARITHEVDQIRAGPVPRLLFFTKILLLHVRYVFGYLAAGFLVSAPLYLGTRLFANMEWDKTVPWHIFYSVVTGLICLIPFVVLIPVTRIDWENMRVPEFKIFELALTRWAMYFAAAYLLFCFNASAIMGRDPKEAWWFDLQIAWFNFTLMVSAWGRIKIQTILFRDFYELETKEGLVLKHRDESQGGRDSEAGASLRKPDAGA